MLEIVLFKISDTLAKIKAPVTPKGVIELPRMRKRTSTERPYAELELTVKEKKLLLTWLTGTKRVAEAMKGKLLDADTVERRPERTNGRRHEETSKLEM